jgi:uncharacterized membrane protein
MELRKFTPRADKKVLIFLAGLMWCGVGVMLIRYAITWLSVLSIKQQVIFFVIGFGVALPIHLFGFSKIASKNLNRLLPMEVKKCVFSFMTWKSYLIVLFMVSLGITLRHSSLPKQYLSIVYNGIGLALFLSGIKYLRAVFIS